MSCDKDPKKIKEMFDEISPYYDQMNNKISLGTHYLIKILAIKKLGIKPRSTVLDVCCGTGDFSKIISKISPKTKVIGLDISENMLKLAKHKNPKMCFLKGDCTQLAFKDNEFDYITIGFGLRNIQNRSQALSEIYRTLKPDGKFLHLDFGNSKFIGKIFDILVPIIVKFSGKNSDNYKYLLQSKNEFPTPDELISEFETHGFKYISKQDYLFGIISAQIMKK